MAVKITQMVALRAAMAQRFEIGIDAYLDEISDGYADYLSPVLEEGETVFDTRAQLVLLRRRIAWHREALEELEQSVLEQEVGNVKTSQQIESLKDGVDAKLRSVRSMFRGTFGLEHLGRVGLKGAFPRRAKALARRAQVVKHALENPDMGLGRVLAFDKDESTERARMAKRLEPELGALVEILDARYPQSSETVDVKSRRRQQVADFDYHVRAILKMIQGMFKLAGRPDLAAQFRWILRGH